LVITGLMFLLFQFEVRANFILNSQVITLFHTSQADVRPEGLSPKEACGYLLHRRIAPHFFLDKKLRGYYFCVQTMIN
jgi:hypothetical protein